MKRHQKKVQELEQENKVLQKENEELKYNLANISSTSGGSAQKLKEGYLQKLNDLEKQVSELKRKLDAQSQPSNLKLRSDDAMKRLQDEILRMKAQKVELQRKIKEESMQFRLCKLLLEKEVLQLKKEAMRKEYEMHNVSALNQRLKLVLRRKTEEAFMATKRLKELLGSRKALLRETSGAGCGNCPRIQAIEHELKVVRVNEVHSESEQQMEERAVLAKEVKQQKEEAEIQKQKKLRCLLQDIEVECRQKDLEIKDLVQDIKVDCGKKDLEIRDLKEQVVKLSNLVRQLEMQKAEICHTEKSQNLSPMEHSMEDAATSGKPRSSITSNCAGSNSESSEVVNTFESEHSEGINALKVKNVLGVCCSCSKNSLCKTTKCKCRATGGTCGTSCGCAPSKCTNKESILIRLDDSPPSEVVDDIKKCSGTVETEENCTLAAYGAMLLQSALVEKPAEINDNGVPRRKPLSDVGNILIKSNALKPKRGKKGKKSVTQLVQVAPSSSQPGNSKALNEPEKCAMEADIQSKLPRAMRSAAMNSNSLKQRNSDLPDKSGIPAPRSPIQRARRSD